MASLALACRCLIGLVFAVSAFSKLRSRSAFREFRSWLAGLPVPLARSRPSPVAAAMAVAEAAIVVLSGLAWTAGAAPGLAAPGLSVVTAGAWLAVARGAGTPCQCVGASAPPLGRRPRGPD